jgi:hypothetical protein
MKQPPLVEALNLKLFGVPTKDALIARIVLAAELVYVRLDLCYLGPGYWRQYRREAQSGGRVPWVKYVQENVGCDEGTARGNDKCRQVVLRRMQAAEFPEKAAALALMEARPSQMTEAERASLAGHIGSVLRDNDTLTSLRREYRRRHPLPPRAGTDTGALTVRENSAMVQNGGPFRQSDPLSYHSMEKLAAAMEFVENAPAGVFWLLLAAAVCRVRAGVQPHEQSEIEIAVMAKAYLWEYELRQGNAIGPASDIAAMAEWGGSSPAEGVAIAQMILLDVGKGFPVPSKQPKPSAET